MKRAWSRGPERRKTLERYYRRNCEKGSTVAHGDAAENERTGFYYLQRRKIPRHGYPDTSRKRLNWIRGEIRRGVEQEIELFDRESEAPETLARETIAPSFHRGKISAQCHGRLFQIGSYILYSIPCRGELLKTCVENLQYAWRESL